MSLASRLLRRSLITTVGLVLAAVYVVSNPEVLQEPGGTKQSFPKSSVLRADIAPLPSDAPSLGNPLCVTGADQTKTVRWDYGSLAQVWVSVDGAEETFFACGVSGDREAPSIQPGRTYVFRLYEASTCDPSDRGDVPVAGVPVTVSSPSPEPTSLP